MTDIGRRVDRLLALGGEPTSSNLRTFRECQGTLHCVKQQYMQAAARGLWRRSWRMLPLALVCASQAATAWAAQPPIALWRLDCGRFGTSVPDSCYLIRHGDTFMPWDTGLNPGLAHRGEHKVGTHAVTLYETLPEQLARLGLVPRDIAIVALSHAHFDHVGGAVSFPRAVNRQVDRQGPGGRS